MSNHARRQTQHDCLQVICHRSPIREDMLSSAKTPTRSQPPCTQLIRRESADLAGFFALNPAVAMRFPSLSTGPKSNQKRKLLVVLLLTEAVFSRMSASG